MEIYLYYGDYINMNQTKTTSDTVANSAGVETTSNTYTITYKYPCDECPGCEGRGWQEGNDGIRVTCPMCGGTGCWKRSVPYYWCPAETYVYPVKYPVMC